MKKVTFFLFIFGCFLSLSAQHVFNAIPGPVNVPAGTPSTVNVNDAGNSASVPASSTGSYNAFSISVDWVNGFDAWSSEADITVTTAAGSVTIDPPTSGGLTGGGNTTLTFEGDLAGLYDPLTDGLLDLVLNQSFPGSNADWSNIVVTLFETPTCPEPSNLNVTGLTSDSADLDWTAGNTETAWNLEWNSGADFTPGNGEEEGAATVNGAPATTLSSLTPSTQYFLYYQAECAVGDTSLWVGPITFTTENVPPPPPVGVTCSSGSSSFVYTGDFESVDGWTGDLNAGNGSWELPGPQGADSVDTGPDAAFSGTGYLLYEASGGTTATASAVSPAIDLGPALDGAELSFYMHAYGEDMGTLNVGISNSPSGPFTTLFTWVGELQTSSSADWVPVGINLDAYLGQTVYVEFSHTGIGDFNGDMSIDFLRVETCGTFCIAPSAVSVDNLTSDSADISWIANSGENSWEYVVQPAGTGVPTSGTAVATTSVSVTGLTPETDYEIYVRANCSTGDSVWAGPINFTTPFVSNFTVDCSGGGPVNTVFCYFDDIDDDPSVATFTYTSNDGSPLRLTFNEGQVESCCDELVVLDSDGVTELFNGTNGGDLSGLVFDSTGDTISWYINSDFSINCQGSGFTPVNASVACATCVNPVADYAVVSDCINGPQFTIDVDLSDLGSAASVTLSDNIDPANDQIVSATGIYSFGPYPNTTDVVITATNNDDSNCVVSSAALTQEFCTEVFLDCTSGGPVTLDYCYDNDGEDSPVIFEFTSLDGTPLNLTFNSGFVENGWDELVVLDSDGTPFPGWEPGAPGFGNGNFGNAGNLAGFTFQSTGDSISWYINSDGSVSCVTGSFGNPLIEDGINYTVACATCINPQATYAVIDDCDNGDQFLIDVNISDLGDATSLTISNNINGDTLDNITAPGIYQVGPFPFLVDVIVTVSNDQDGNCVINSQAIQLLACPPDNDNPCDATVAAVNPDDTCTVTTPGTIIAATPSGVPTGSCSGDPDDDVWFEFVATAEQHVINITNIAGGTTNLDHGVYEGACTGLTELYCSPDAQSLTPVLTIGNTYYVRVFSAGSVDETSTFDLCINTFSTDFCTTALPICADPNIDYPSVVGDQVAPPFLDYDCLGSQPDPQWNFIFFDDPGDYVFSLDQVSDTGVPLDIDFIVWGPFVDGEEACGGLITPNIQDCSFSPTASETITLNNVPANSVYVILITNFSQQPGTYTFTQDSGPPQGTNCDVVCDVVMEIEGAPIDDDVADLGTPDEILDYCGFDSVTLEATTFYEVDQYIWYQDGFVIPGATDPTYVASETGTYQVQVLGGICDPSAFYFSALVQLNFYDDPGNLDPQLIEVCDGPEADGVEDFDLDALTATFGYGPEFVVSYYTNLSDANQAINPVSSPYNSSGETLIIRVEDVQAAADGFLGCREISEVELVVLATPAIGNPVNLETCSANSTADFMLTDNDVEVLAGGDPTTVTLTYHSTLADAEAGVGALASPYTGSNGEEIFVRLENNDSGCFNLASFMLVINPPTQIALSQNIEECDDNDGVLDDIANFDLDAHTTIVLDGQDAASFNVTYHNTQADAENNVGALASNIATASTTVWVRVEDVLLPNCYVVNSFDLVVLDEVTATISTDVFYFDTDTNEFLLCPEAESGVVLTILPDGFSASEVTIEWFRDGSPEPDLNGLTVEVFDEGDYTADIVLNATGCVFTLEVPAVIEFENCVFPQGISPGVSPGLNDTFDLRYFDVTRLEIFNRNGTRVYAKDNYTNEWVGQTDDGSELPVGTYFYTMVYEGGTKTRTGWIYINR